MPYHFHELGILNHHCMNDPKKAFVRRKDSNATSQGVSLHETLADMLTQNLNDTTTTSIGKLIPLEVPVTRIKNCIKFVTLQLIW